MDKPFSAYRGSDPYVFVCYAHEDAQVVYPEIQWLADQGVNVWYDEGISAGSNWRSAIGEALLNAHRILFYISRHSLESDHCNREINLALDENKAVVPVYLEEVTLTPDLKVGLNRVQALHHADSPSYRSQLIDALGTVSASEAQASQITPSAPKPRMRRWHYAALSVLLLLAVSGAWVYNEYREVGNSFSVAVLPFKSMTRSDTEQVYGQAVAEDIRSALLEMQRSKTFDPNAGEFPLLVSASTASLDAETDLAEIGQDLGAAYLIQGNVEQTEGQIRVRAQLIHAASSTQVWSKLYTRSSDGEDTRTRIARNIAFVVDGEILFNILRRIPDIFLGIYYGSNSTAARHFTDAGNQIRLLRSGEGGDWALAQQYFKQAIEADPDFATAYSLLANTYMNQNQSEGRFSRADAAARAHAVLSEAAARAEEQNNWHLTQLGQLLMNYDLDYAAAESLFQICRDQDPRNYVCHRGSAEIAFREGRMQAAYSFLETSLILDAGSIERGLGQLIHSWYLLIGGQNQKALEAARRASDLIHGGLQRATALRVQMTALAYLGNTEAIAPLLEEAWAIDGHREPGKFAHHFLRVGQTDRARQILKDLDKPDPDAVSAYIALGDIDTAFEAIEAGINDHYESIYTSLRRAPWFEPLRDDPRYDALVDLMESNEIHTSEYLSGRDQ